MWLNNWCTSIWLKKTQTKFLKYITQAIHLFFAELVILEIIYQYNRNNGSRWKIVMETNQKSKLNYKVTIWYDLQILLLIIHDYYLLTLTGCGFSLVAKPLTTSTSSSGNLATSCPLRGVKYSSNLLRDK